MDGRRRGLVHRQGADAPASAAAPRLVDRAAAGRPLAPAMVGIRRHPYPAAAGAGTVAKAAVVLVVDDAGGDRLVAAFAERPRLDVAAGALAGDVGAGGAGTVRQAAVDLPVEHGGRVRLTGRVAEGPRPLV